MNIRFNAMLFLLGKSTLKSSRLYFPAEILLTIFMLCGVGVAQNDVLLSELPKPILQRIEYEFGDTLNVKKIERFVYGFGRLMP